MYQIFKYLVGLEFLFRYSNINLLRISNERVICLLNTRRDIKILDVEKEKGIKDSSIIKDDSSLSKWYHNIRDKRLSSLADGDISRLVRQQLYLEYVIPEAIERLKKNPLSGEQYTGELLTALYKLDESIWSSNNPVIEKLIDLCNKIDDVRLTLIRDYEWIYEEEAEEFFTKVLSLKELLISVKY